MDPTLCLCTYHNLLATYGPEGEHWLWLPVNALQTHDEMLSMARRRAEGRRIVNDRLEQAPDDAAFYAILETEEHNDT